MTFRASRTVAPWICLAAVLIGLLLYVARLHPANYFGYLEDDSVYFSSAKALAEGRGYIQPSFPGTPPGKYPVLLPWLLSWIWWINPSFPANLRLAVWVTLIFACGFFIAAFEFLRERQGLGDWPALFVVAFCAFHPYFLIFSAQLMSDMVFLAVALIAAMLADAALRRNGRIATAIAAGALAGLSIELRTVGLAVVAGIFAAGLYRRTWRQAIIAMLTAAPFLFLTLKPLAGTLGSPHPAQPASLAEPGWTQTLYYTTSYLKFWKLCVPNFSVFLSVMRLNVQKFLVQPGGYLLMPLLPENQAGSAIALILTAAIFAGIVRQARTEEWKPIHFVFIFYAMMILPWSYPLMARFLMLFLPLFLAGLWVEGKHFLQLLTLGSRSGKPISERILAGVLFFGVAAIAATAAWNYFDSFRSQLGEISAHRAASLEEKKEAYDWIRRHAGPQDVVVAYEDAALYLYTGRLSLRPIEFSMESYYRQDRSRAQRDLDHITDAPRHVRARYWMMTDDDYGIERMLPLEMLNTRMAQLKSALPVVFRSRQGNVQIYELACLLEPQKPECLAEAPALFPYASAR